MFYCDTVSVRVRARNTVSVRVRARNLLLIVYLCHFCAWQQGTAYRICSKAFIARLAVAIIMDSNNEEWMTKKLMLN